MDRKVVGGVVVAYAAFVFVLWLFFLGGVDTVVCTWLDLSSYPGCN
jgi:hypothetical protein